MGDEGGEPKGEGMLLSTALHPSDLPAERHLARHVLCCNGCIMCDVHAGKQAMRRMGRRMTWMGTASMALQCAALSIAWMLKTWMRGELLHHPCCRLPSARSWAWTLPRLPPFALISFPISVRTHSRLNPVNHAGLWELPRSDQKIRYSVANLNEQMKLLLQSALCTRY